MKLTKTLLNSFNIRPYNLEHRNIFVERFCKNFDVKALIKSNLQKVIAANKIWEECKKECMVSISITNEEFLIFY